MNHRNTSAKLSFVKISAKSFFGDIFSSSLWILKESYELIAAGILARFQIKKYSKPKNFKFQPRREVSKISSLIKKFKLRKSSLTKNHILIFRVYIPKESIKRPTILNGTSTKKYGNAVRMTSESFGRKICSGPSKTIECEGGQESASRNHFLTTPTPTTFNLFIGG